MEPHIALMQKFHSRDEFVLTDDLNLKSTMFAPTPKCGHHSRRVFKISTLYLRFFETILPKIIEGKNMYVEEIFDDLESAPVALLGFSLVANLGSKWYLLLRIKLYKTKIVYLVDSIETSYLLFLYLVQYY